MDAQPFIDLIAKEWEAIRQAPVAFGAALVSVIMITWVVINYLYANKFGSLEERLKLKQEQLDSYKEKLKVDSPEEAKARLDSLEARLLEIKRDLGEIGDLDLSKKFEEALQTGNINIDDGSY